MPWAPAGARARARIDAVGFRAGECRLTSQLAYTLLVGLVGLERLAELLVARRNAAWSLAQGGLESGRGHYPVMVALHTGFLLACPLEVWGLGRPWSPGVALPALLALLAAQALRWWCITTLGKRWNTRVIVIPGAPRIERGPYRFLRHPNYVAVVVEGLALPLVHGAWLTALGFSLLNLPLLAVRLRCEERALAEAAAR